MLKTKMAPASALLRPYIWAYGTTSGQVDSIPLVIPLRHGPSNCCSFLRGTFPDPPRRIDSERCLAAGGRGRRPVVLPARLVCLGACRQLCHSFSAIRFQPALRLPMTELTDARSTRTPSSDHRFQHSSASSATPRLCRAIQIAEKHLIRLIELRDRPMRWPSRPTRCLRATALSASR